MIEDTVNDMMDAVITWLYDLLAYLARVILHMLSADFTLLSTDAMQYGILLGSGFKVLVFASYAIVIVVGGFLVMSHETLQTRYSLREIAPRLVIGMLLTGIIWTIVHQAVVANNDVVNALVSIDISDEGAICTDPAYDWRTDDIAECDWQEGAEHSQFAYWVSFSPRADQEIELFHIIMIIISIVCLLVLLVTSILRYIVLFFVATLAPIAVACHGLPITEQFAHLWWRMLGACMASSIGQAALIWMWHEMRTYLPDEDDDLLGYSSITWHVHLMVLVWMMWKVHAEAFRIARGRPVKVPGSRLLAAFVMSKFAGRGHKPKRKFSTPGTIWGTDMRRPPWRREKTDSDDGTAKQAPSGGQGGGATSGSGKGSLDKGPNGGGSGGGSGRPAAPEKPASPHDQRADAEPVTTLGGDAPDAAPEPGRDRDAPPWKRPLPKVTDGGFDPDIAATSLHGHPGSDGIDSAKPGTPASKPVPGKPNPAPRRPEAGPGGAAPKPASGSAGSTSNAVPPRRPEATRPRADGILPPATPPEAESAPARLPEAAGPAPSSAPAPASPEKQLDAEPLPRSSTPKPTEPRKEE
ncbi:hypothetical protein [Glycomyces tenuis]|uniref:hypothetical protein n=1 Tax=Glycomyces tenuis TaxID=58116 RepID=UPI00040A596A|nr:hypothetical protein [Glycomyces tenuis]